MKKVSIILAILLICFSNINTQNPVATKPHVETQSFKRETANLFILEIEESHKTIIVGDGISPLSWRFRIPDSKWICVYSVLKVEDSVIISWVGAPLSDPASLESNDEYNGLCVLKSLSIYKPIKVF